MEEHTEVIIVNMEAPLEPPMWVSLWRANEISRMNDIDGMAWSLAEYGRCDLGDFLIILAEEEER